MLSNRATALGFVCTIKIIKYKKEYVYQPFLKFNILIYRDILY